VLDMDDQVTSVATGTVEEAMHARIRNAGLRLTLPRRAICAVLASNGERFLAIGDILAAVQETSGPVDPSTVYRTLEEFARIGLVHHVHHGTRPGRWHLTMHHDHLHLVCERCDATEVVPTADVQPMLDLFDDAHGFKAFVHHFAILGLCRNCRTPDDHPHD
jgi:Fur family ferric uptake transcriptional regulator